MLTSQPSLGDASFWHCISSFNTTFIVRVDELKQQELGHYLERLNQWNRDLNWILKDRYDLEGWLRWARWLINKGDIIQATWAANLWETKFKVAGMDWKSILWENSCGGKRIHEVWSVQCHHSLHDKWDKKRDKSGIHIGKEARKTIIICRRCDCFPPLQKNPRESSRELCKIISQMQKYRELSCIALITNWKKKT